MRVFHYPAGLRPAMPELLREIRAPRPAHILELPRGDRLKILAATIIYTDSSRDIIRAQAYSAALERLAEILQKGSL